MPRFGIARGTGWVVAGQSGAGKVLRSRGGRLLRAVAATVASAVPVALIAFAVRQEFDPIITADNAAIRAATRFSRAHQLTSSLLTMQQVTQPVVVYPACTIGLIWVGLTKGMRGRALWAFVTMMTGWAIGGVSKVLVQRVRPVVDDPLSHSPGYSFPSGHALISRSPAARWSCWCGRCWGSLVAGWPSAQPWSQGSPWGRIVSSSVSTFPLM